VTGFLQPVRRALEDPVSSLAVESNRLDAFYRDLLHALDEHMQDPRATLTGFGVIAKRVAREHGVTVVDRVPLPRLTRSQREGRRAW
jgi:hypothetical protein